MKSKPSHAYLLSGSTESCLADFAQRFPADTAATLLVEFIGINRSTARAWLRNRRMPGGEELLRLRCFLDSANYRVEELFRLPEVTRQLARLVAFNVLDLDDVRRTLGYSNLQEIYRVVLRGSGIMSDKVERLQRLVRDNEDKLPGRQNSWQERLKASLSSDHQEREPAPPGTMATADKPSTGPDLDRLTVQALINAMSTTTALGDLVTTSHHSGMRSARQAVKPDDVRRLIQVLERLLP